MVFLMTLETDFKFSSYSSHQTVMQPLLLRSHPRQSLRCSPAHPDPAAVRADVNPTYWDWDEMTFYFSLLSGIGEKRIIFQRQ